MFAPAVYGTLNLQLPWVADVESAGEFVADARGYFRAEGFSGVHLIAGGPSVAPQETQVETGKALLAITSLDAAATAIARGRPLVVIGAEYQKSPYCVMSLQSRPINDPQGMIGKRIGVQPDNEAVWSAFLKANNIDPARIKKIPVQFDPLPLAAGQVDGWFSLVTNEPVGLAVQGIKTSTFLLNDFGYPGIGNVFIATLDSVATVRSKVKAALTAEIIGWRDVIQHPDNAAQLTVSKYAAGTARLAVQQQQVRAQTTLMATGDALTSGLFSVTAAAQTATVKTLALGGTSVTPSQLFDMSLLGEIYAARADLRSVPTPGAPVLGTTR